MQPLFTSRENVDFMVIHAMQQRTLPVHAGRHITRRETRVSVRNDSETC